MKALCSTHGEVEAAVTRDGHGKIIGRYCHCNLLCQPKPRRKRRVKDTHVMHEGVAKEET